MTQYPTQCAHACCSEARTRVFYHYKTFRWLLMTENLKTISIQFCPFCGEELI